MYLDSGDCDAPPERDADGPRPRGLHRKCDLLIRTGADHHGELVMVCVERLECRNFLQIKTYDPFAVYAQVIQGGPANKELSLIRAVQERFAEPRKLKTPMQQERALSAQAQGVRLSGC